MNTEKFTLWCEFKADGIIGTYFFKNDGDLDLIIVGKLSQKTMCIPSAKSFAVIGLISW